jgi:RNA-binding motif X-linked protein 2
MSQWGEIEDINLVREKGTNKSMGFAFIKYEDQRSTILAVDNFNGISLLGRVLRCDHVDQYKLPKHIREQEEAKLEEDPSLDIHIGPGHAYSGQELENGFSVTKGMDLWSTTARGIGVAVDAARPTNEDNGKVYDKSEDDSDTEKDRSKKKKHKHHKSKHSKKRDRSEHSDNYDRDKADDRHKTKSADGYRRRRSRSRSKERSIRKRSRSRSMDGDRGEGVSKGNNLSTPSVNAVNKNSGAAYNTLPHMADNGKLTINLYIIHKLQSIMYNYRRWSSGVLAGCERSSECCTSFTSKSSNHSHGCNT